MQSEVLNVINDLKLDMTASSVDDVTIITRAQLEALEAALSAAEPQPAPSVAVKALKWNKDAGKPADLYVVAKSVVGSYHISPMGREGFELRLFCADPFPIYGSMAEAKAAAQSDYEARIRSALSAQVQDVAGNDTQVKGAFNHGYVIACCNVTNLHDEPGIAHDTLRELGVSKSEVKRMDLCDYDAKALREIERARGPNSSLYAAAPAKQEG